MGVDLNLANRIWKETRRWYYENQKEINHEVSQETIDTLVPYSAAVAIVSCLLANKKLAEEIVAENWEDADITEGGGGN